MVAIIDYGVGNLFSLKSSLAAIGAEAVVAADPALLAAADKIILPGVGAFEDAARKLRTYGFVRSEMHLRPDCNGHFVMQRCWYPIY